MKGIFCKKKGIVFSLSILLVMLIAGSVYADSTLPDGSYTVQTSLMKASNTNKPSMAEDALAETGELEVTGGQWYLKVEFKPLKLGLITGRAYNIRYYDYDLDSELYPVDVLTTYQHDDYDYPARVGMPVHYNNEGVFIKMSVSGMPISPRAFIKIDTSGVVLHTISASAGANGSIYPEGDTAVLEGSNQTYTITPDAGYHIKDVLIDDQSVGALESYQFTNVTADHSIVASFEADEVYYTITASAGSNGTISPDGASEVLKGGNQIYTIAANDGYHVKDVLVDGQSVGAVVRYDFTNVMADHTISATFEEDGVPELALSKDGNGIKASWTAIPDVDGYQLFRAHKAAGPFLEITDTDNLTYTDTEDLISGMPYFYKVRAYRVNQVGTFYGEFSAVKGYYAPGALAKPDAPELTLDENAGGIRLNWNQQDRIVGYQVFRSVSPDKPFKYLQTSPGTATKYTNIAGLTQGRPYYYKMRAYRMAKGVRAYSDFSDIKGLFAGTDEPALDAVKFVLGDNPNVTAPNVRVVWQKVDGAGGYCIYRWDSPNQRWIGLKKTGPNARVYTNINGVVNNKMYYYGLRPYHVSGTKTYYGNIGKAKGYMVDK